MKIYRPKIGASKGKIVQKKYPQVKKYYIMLPKELSAENLLLTTISFDINYKSAHYVKKKTIQEYEKVLEEMFRIYNETGSKLSEIRVDTKFKSVLEFIRNKLNIFTKK